MYRSLIKGCLYFFLFSVRCVYARMCIFFFFFNEICKICHGGERCDLSNLAHIYLFYSYTDVKFTWGRSEMLLLPVPFELCMCPYKCFFWVETWGGKKHTGYNELQLLICRQYYISGWTSFIFLSSLTEHWGLSVPLTLSLQLMSRESLNPLRLDFQLVDESYLMAVTAAWSPLLRGGKIGEEFCWRVLL